MVKEANKEIFTNKRVVGLVEKVKVINPDTGKYAELYALMDSGATTSSLDLRIAANLNLSLTKYKIVKAKTIFGDKIIRPTVKAVVEVKGEKILLDQITITDRSSLSLPMIIGRDLLYGRFVIDVSLTHNSEKIDDLIDNIDLKEVSYNG